MELTAKLDEFKVDNSKNSGDQNGGDDEGSGPQEQGGKLGLTLRPVTPEMSKQLGLDSDTEGMAVTEVDPSGPAAEAGIDRGDVILEINRKPVSSLDDVRSALSSSEGKPILLLISRRGQTMYLTVRPD
jgi:serine protease Do